MQLLLVIANIKNTQGNDQKNKKHSCC